MCVREGGREGDKKGGPPLVSSVLGNNCKNDPQDMGHSGMSDPRDMSLGGHSDTSDPRDMSLGGHSGIHVNDPQDMSLGGRPLWQEGKRGRDGACSYSTN